MREGGEVAIVWEHYKSTEIELSEMKTLSW